MYIDTHCHLHDEKFDGIIDRVVLEYEKYGIKAVIDMGCTYNTSLIGKTLSEKYQSVYFGAGVHPSDAKDFTEEDYYKIKELLSHEKCVAVGEIGLDYYWDKSYNDIQKRVLIAQLELAKETKMPFSLHSRDATLDTLTILKENKDKIVNGGVIHCFSGSKETAKEYMDLGLYIGFDGPITFKNADKPREVVKYVPKEYILTETDSPYLAPEPKRGKLNTPENIPIILEKIASVKGLDLEELKSVVYLNAKNLFKKLK